MVLVSARASSDSTTRRFVSLSVLFIEAASGSGRISPITETATTTTIVTRTTSADSEAEPS